jgi:O-antigen ligase
LTASALNLRRRELPAGAALGAYAGLIALVPETWQKIALCAPLAGIPLFVWLMSSATRWITVFLVFAWLLPPFPVAIGNSGPHLAVLVAGAGLFAGLVRLPGWRLRPDWLSSSLLALFACFSVSLGFALAYSGPAIALASTARLLLFAISVYAFLYLRFGPVDLSPDWTAGFVRALFLAAAASAALACVDFYFQFPAPAGYGPQFIWLDTGVFRRAQGVFYEASTLGNLCAFFLVMVAVGLSSRNGVRFASRWMLLAGAMPLAFALVLSYSRASAVDLLVALAVLVLLERRRIRWIPAISGLLGIGAGGGLALAWLFPAFLSTYIQRAAASMQYFFESPNAVLSGRLDTWSRLFEYLVAHPQQLLFGIGYKTLPYSTFLGSTVIADNTYLSVLAEAGVLGLIALAGLNVAILAASYRAARSHDKMRTFAGTWMLCFWSGQIVQMMSADLLTYWRVLPAYFCILAIATAES